MENFAIYLYDTIYIKIEYKDDYVLSIKRVHLKENEIIEDFGLKNSLTENVNRELLEYFQGKRKDFTFKYKLRGTDFQKKVWQALCDIPYGETRSYKEIAEAVGNSKASRAVGMANNKNPITIAVPCHRVIGANGKLVGYGGGIDMKITLLNLEKAYS